MRFSIYKPGQGKYTRIASALGAAVVVGLGCFRLYAVLEPINWGLGRRAALWISTMVPAGLFVILCFLIFWLVNKQTIADFMVAAEGEIKKVNWSSRKEIAVSTFVVIVVVVMLASLLGVTDLTFRVFFTWLLS